VLIVDDNRDAADSMADLLRVFGHDIEVAYDSESALRLYADRRTDLALLDIGLPDMDGYELARRLRQTLAGCARFVALTGFGTGDTGKKLAEAGFDMHVVKPISPEALASLLEETPAHS
jgi:CheY-like chemotaxis protein